MRRWLSAALLTVMLCLGTEAHAANFYVRAAASGSGNGSDWTNAWTDVTSIVWASISPGDVIYASGGSYGQLTWGKAGNADTTAGRVFFKRATTATHGTATGWDNSYDTQVILSKVLCNSLTLCNYTTLDGQQPSGIYISVAAGAGSVGAVQWNRGSSFNTVQYVEMVGPCSPTPCVIGADIRGIDATAQSNEAISNLIVRYNIIHGLNTQIYIANCDNAIIEHNTLYDNKNTDTVPFHANQIYTFMSDNVVIRYNIFRDYAFEGIIMKAGGIFGSSGTFYIYNNLFYRTTGGGPFDRVLEANGPNVLGDPTSIIGPVYFYNNTVVGLWNSWRAGNKGQWHSSTESKNNIYWNTPVGSGATGVDGEGPPNRSYDFSSGTVTGTGSISTGSNPFVNSATYDFHLISTVSAVYPRDKGTSLNPSNLFLLDFDGLADNGARDMGAYEYGGGAPASAPAAPSNVRLLTNPDASVASLIWTANTESNLAGYKIYYSTTSGAFPTIAATITPATAAAAQSDTTHRDLLMPTSGTWYLIVKAFNTQGVESAASLEVSGSFPGLTAKAARQ